MSERYGEIVETSISCMTKNESAISLFYLMFSHGYRHSLNVVRSNSVAILGMSDIVRSGRCNECLFTPMGHISLLEKISIDCEKIMLNR